MVRGWRFVLGVVARVEQQGGRVTRPQAGRLNRGWTRSAMTTAKNQSVRFLAVVTVAVLTTLVPPASEAQPPALFTSVNETPPPGPLGAETLRSRVVTMDLGQVRHAQAAAASRGRTVSTKDAAPPPQGTGTAPAPGTTLTFNLFDDVVVTGVVKRTAPTFSGGYSVAGHLVEEPLGTMTLVVNGETVAGTVRTLEATYQIRSVGDGLYAISEVEEPPLNCGVEGPHTETDHQH